MEGGQAELDHHQQGHVAPHVNQLHQETRHNGQEVANRKEETCLGTACKMSCDGVDMKGATFGRHQETYRYNIGTQSQEGWDGIGQENGSNPLGPGLEWGAFCPSSEQYDAYGTTSIYSDLSTRL